VAQVVQGTIGPLAVGASIAFIGAITLSVVVSRWRFGLRRVAGPGEQEVAAPYSVIAAELLADERLREQSS
jgi:hypothetical protein